MTDHPSLLRVDGAAKSYGGVRALRSVDLSVRAGEVHGLVGENGAGKSTLIKVIAGATALDAGEIEWDGAPVELDGVFASMQLGIRVIFQELSVIDHLSVAENICLGAERTHLGWISRSEAERRAKEALARFGVPLAPSRNAGTLRVAEKQLVEIARALTFDARLIIMDEPTAALGHDEVARLLALMQDLRQHGVAVLFVSHRLEEVLSVSDRVTVMRDGETVSTVDAAATTRSELIRRMVGREAGHAVRKPSHRTSEVVLRARELVTREGLAGVSLELHRGEVLGVYGLLGSGRTELARALVGADPLVAGEIEVAGQPARVTSPAAARRLGIGLVPEERKTQAIFADRPVRENISSASADRFAPRGLVRSQRERDFVAPLMSRLRIKARGMEVAIGTLSGGNQQKAVLARWLGRAVPILVLDDPTVGIDVGAKDELYQLLAELTRDGTAVVLTSSELPEVIGLSDRVMVLHERRVAGVVEGEESSQQRILELALTGAAA